MPELPGADDPQRLLADARRLRDRGERGKARAAYLSLLMHDRYHCEAMVDLADLYLVDGDVRAARIIATEAVARHPDSAVARCVLGSALLEADELHDAGAAFTAALELQPMNRKAWAGLGVVLERTGDLDAADAAWRAAFSGASPAISQYRGDGDPVHILLLWSAVEGNIPLKPVLDDRQFQWSTLFVESFDESVVLPPHDVVLNAVGNADLRTRALAMVQRVLASTRAPVINDPARVRETGRVAIAERLRAIPHVVTPRIASAPRTALADPGFGWPLLVRSPGYHSGEHFVYVADASALETAIAYLPGEELLAISYVDTRREDGTVRKYRVLAVDSELYPLHLAISRDWKVHYFSADMRPEHRSEERAFLNDMRGVLGGDAIEALQAIAALLQLDYLGIDFTLDHMGNVVVFEANATMAIVPPGTSRDEAYRREPVDRAISAVQAMIRRRRPTV